MSSRHTDSDVLRRLEAHQGTIRFVGPGSTYGTRGNYRLEMPGYRTTYYNTRKQARAELIYRIQLNRAIHRGW